jgi:hypothetical protein
MDIQQEQFDQLASQIRIALVGNALAVIDVGERIRLMQNDNVMHVYNTLDEFIQALIERSREAEL